MTINFNVNVIRKNIRWAELWPEPLVLHRAQKNLHRQKNVKYRGRLAATEACWQRQRPDNISTCGTLLCEGRSPSLRKLLKAKVSSSEDSHGGAE